MKLMWQKLKRPRWNIAMLTTALCLTILTAISFINWIDISANFYANKCSWGIGVDVGKLYIKRQCNEMRAEYYLPLIIFILPLVLLVAADICQALFKAENFPVCAKCRYNLTGCQNPTCPECGADIPQELSN